MAIKVNFANGTYTEDDFNEEFASIVGSTEKIVIGEDSSLKITQSSPLGLKVTIKSGKCFINGKFCVNDSNADVTIESNLSGATRKDIIVLDVADPQAPVFKAIKGNASAPTPTANQILLAEISVKNNSLSIMDADISDKRVFRNNRYIVEYSIYGKHSENEQVVIRWNNGEMEIRGVTTPKNVNCNQTWGSIKISDPITQVNFKRQFIGTPVLTYAVNGLSAQFRCFLIQDYNIGVSANSTCSWLLCSAESKTALTVRIGFTAKGYWK